jgi:hypothetical protein
METPGSKKIPIFRNEEKILFLLDEYKKSNLSIKGFCIENDISSASFHNWKKKYSKRMVKPGRQPGFAKLQITPPAVVSAPFAEVKGIKIYQWVTASYLKELLA